MEVYACVAQAGYFTFGLGLAPGGGACSGGTADGGFFSHVFKAFEVNLSREKFDSFEHFFFPFSL